jgi:hypothetical protein
MQEQKVKAKAAPSVLDQAEAAVLSFWEVTEAASGPLSLGAEPRTRYETDKYINSDDRSPFPPALPQGTIPSGCRGVAPSASELAATPRGSTTARLHQARRLMDCPSRIRMCGRAGFRGLPEIIQRTDRATGEVSGGWGGLAACGHRWCPYCGPRGLTDTAARMTPALEDLSAEGWRIALGVLTFPHLAQTPEAALAGALRAGMAEVSAVMKDYRTPAAARAAATLRRADEYELSQTRRAELSQTIREGSLLWWARVELTLGVNGLHPHLNILLLIPPAATAPKGIYQGAERDPEAGHVHLSALEATLGHRWTSATLRALRRLDPPRAGRYRAPDADLDDDRDDRAARVAALTAEAAAASPLEAERLTRALAGAALDLAAAEAAARHDSPERRALRWRACSVLAWEGPVGAAASYALGLGPSTSAAPSDGDYWSAADEWAGPGKLNDLWRALDAADTAPRWARWCQATEGVRMTRSSRGLVEWLETRAEAAVTDPAPAPVKRRLAVAHPLVVQWARDQGRERDLHRAAAAGPAPLAAWWEAHAPAPLRPLLLLLPDAPVVDEQPEDELTAARRAVLRAHEGSGLGWGYWMGPDGRPVAWTDKDGKHRTDRQPPSRRAEAAARADDLWVEAERTIVFRRAASGRPIPPPLALLAESRRLAEVLADIDLSDPPLAPGACP